MIFRSFTKITQTGYGAIAGVVIISIMTAGMVFGDGGGSQVQGYLTMIVVLSLIFVGVKRYRD